MNRRVIDVSSNRQGQPELGRGRGRRVRVNRIGIWLCAMG